MSSNTFQRLPLVSGHAIPNIGLGVYQTPKNEARTVVYKALKLGYRHIDSARAYNNEGEVCEGIAQWLNEDPVNNKREDLFYTTKVRDEAHGYELTKEAIRDSLKFAENIGYIDLILVHTPKSDKERRHGTWVALQEAVSAKDSKIKSIGISNYGVKHIKELFEYPDLTVKPVLNQIELHPWLLQKDIVEYSQKHGIEIEAYCPITQGQKLNDPDLVKIAEHYKKTPAQVLIKWSIQKGYIPLPKSTNETRLIENLDVFDFTINDEDVAILDKEKEILHVCWDPTIYGPDDE